METDNMLRAIDKLRMKDGISYADECDIRTWSELACQGGADFDTTRLQEKSRERIAAIFHRTHEVKS